MFEIVVEKEPAENFSVPERHPKGLGVEIRSLGSEPHMVGLGFSGRSSGGVERYRQPTEMSDDGFRRVFKLGRESLQANHAFLVKRA